MTERKRMQLTSLRSACLLIIFMSGWLGAPLRLALPEDPSCSMECCLANGYCSCRMTPSGARAEDDHDHPDFAWSTEEAIPQPVGMAAISLGAPCSEKCAQVPSGIRNIAAHRTDSSGQTIVLSLKQQIFANTYRSVHDTLIVEAIGPRAPPVLHA